MSATLASVPSARAANVSFTLTADLSGWNASQPGGSNPTLTVSPGDTVTVTINRVNSFHNWALYPPGTTATDVQGGTVTALYRTSDVSSASPTAAVTFTITQQGIYEYFCDYHPFQMHGRLVVDATAPVISTVAATPSSQSSGGFVNITATVTDDTGVTAVNVHVVGPSFGENLTMVRLGADTWYLNRTYGVAGSYTSTIWATDPAGRLSSSSASFTIVAAPDTTDPTISSVSAAPPSQASGGFVNVTAAITDDTAVTSVWVNVTGPSGALNATMTRLGASTWYRNATYAAEGTYTFAIWATDAAGNWASAAGTFEILPSPVIDRLPPDSTLLILGSVLVVIVIAAIALLFARRRRPRVPPP